MRADGRTLREIAAAVGVTRERVRQVFLKIGGPTAGDARAAAAARQHAAAAFMEQRIRVDVDVHQGSTLDEIACRLGVDRSRVQAHLPADLRPLVIAPGKSTERMWSDEEVMSVVAAAGTYAYPLSDGDYEDLLRSSEVRGPSAARIIQLYGNWSAACRCAGVEPTPPRRPTYQSRWTDADILAFVRDYLRAQGSRGTFAGYDPWRRDAGAEAPSSALLRGRLGSWSDIKRKALEG